MPSGPWVLFCCYLLMPLAFILGLAAVKSWWGAAAILVYYALLMSSLWRCRKLSLFYQLALVVTVIHAIAAQLFLGRSWFGFTISEDLLIPILIFGILAVYVLTSWAASRLAFRAGRNGEAVFHFLAPGAIFSLAWLPMFGFGVYLLQGFRGACLARASQIPVESSESDIGFSPSPSQVG